MKPTKAEKTKLIKKLLKAIREKCMDCCCYQPKEIRHCQADACPLHAYRMGGFPKKK